MLLVMIILVCFFRGTYSLYLYSIVSYGEINRIRKKGHNYGYVSEHLLLILHY